MSETSGKHLGQASGTEHTYVFTVRPDGKEIWSAHVFREHHLVCVLARGLVERELTTEDLTEHVRRLIVSHIDALC